MMKARPVPKLTYQDIFGQANFSHRWYEFFIQEIDEEKNTHPQVVRLSRDFLRDVFSEDIDKI
jgi:hypothetical protein